MNRKLISIVAAAILALPGVAAAANAEQTQAMSERAAAHIKAVGEKQAFDDFTKGASGFKDGELYVFCYAPDGVNLAHGGNPAFVGKNLMDVKDPDGVMANAEIIKMGQTQGKGWVDFKWVNPVSKKIEPKSAYVIKTGNAVCGVGYYH